MDNFYFDFHGFNNEEEERKILQPLIYVNKLPHDKFSEVFVKALNVWYEVPEEKAEQIWLLFEMYTSILCLFDDMGDSSDTRRFYPTAHKVYGFASTLYAATYGTLILQRKCLQLHPEACQIYIEESFKMKYGETFDVNHRSNEICPSEELYQFHGNLKFHGYSAIAFRWLQLFSKNKIDVTKLHSLLSEWYILRDDYLNIFDKRYNEYHGYATDISEGKFTTPIIYAINKKPDDPRITQILKQKTKDPVLLKEAIDILLECGSKKYMEDKIADVRKRLDEELKMFKPNPKIIDFIDMCLF